MLGRNVIGSNTIHGIGIADAAGTQVLGNYIGVDTSGLLSKGNLGDGIRVLGTSSGTRIGGINDGEGNVVANNTGDGILVSSSSSTAAFILRNSIYNNGEQGIDLGADNGVSANDAGDTDTGSNGILNFPVLTAVSSASGGTTITGSFNSTANTTFRLEFFTNRPTIADAANGEGERYIGFTEVTTNGSGNATINLTLTDAWVNASSRISATATLISAGNYVATSEFAANVTATSSGIVVVDTNSDTSDGTTTSISALGAARGADGRISLREAITATNNTANGTGADRIVFAIPDMARTYESGTVNAAIPDNTTVTSTIPITNSGTVSDINVRVNINHTYDADLEITLIAPDGTRVQLAYQNGGANDNFTNTVFDDEASTAISAGAAPFTGSFRPLSPLWVLDGRSASGNWTLEVKDLATTDTGTLLDWGLTMSLNPTSGVVAPQIINAASALPSVTQALIIDGWTQAGYTTTPIIELTGNNAGTTRDGLTLASGSAGSTIRGFIINRFTGDGIEVNTSNSSVIEGNWIGLNTAGTAASANALRGINALNSTGLTIGGTSTASRNVISGNSQQGIYFDNVDNSFVYGNYVGTNAAGTGDINGTTSNTAQSGFVLLNGSSGNQIGNTSLAGARNVFSGNNHYGVEIQSLTSTNNTVVGNFIGTDVTGLAALGNTNGGFSFWGSGTGNLLGGNVIPGIWELGSGRKWCQRVADSGQLRGRGR